MASLIQIAAARRYAPPLIVVAPVDRRGAKLRQINCRAVDYARNAGMGLETVYPGGLRRIRALAPPSASPEAGAFVRATGLTQGDIYPAPSAFAGERAPRRWRWGWVAVGLIVGAALGGPFGAAAGGLLGATR